MPEGILFMTFQLSTYTYCYNLIFNDKSSVIEVYKLNLLLKDLPDISAGTWTMTSGTGSATFSPDSYDPNAIVTVSEFSPVEHTLTEQNGYCIYNAVIEVAFFGVPVANSGFHKGKFINLHINLTSPLTVS